MNVLEVGLLSIAIYFVVLVWWLKYDERRGGDNHAEGDET